MTRFNRNIMECKFEYFNKSKRRTFSFNRNIMECKYIRAIINSNVTDVLIETLWNVNSILYNNSYEYRLAWHNEGWNRHNKGFYHHQNGDFRKKRF